MKIKNLIISAGLSIITMAFAPAKKDEFKVVKEKSKVEWVGKKVTGQHTGNINISEGKLVTEGNNIKGGSFEMDMTSITNTDLKDEGYNQKLVGHLKSDDFFATQKFPKSTFVITSITNTGKDQYKVKGDLTIKGITKPIEFPATIQNVGNELRAKAKIVVDRTKYDIRYGSGSFFDNLGDKAINDEFEMNVDLVTKK